MSDLQRLAAHNVWANQRLMACLRDHGWAEHPAKLMSHVVLAEAVWYHRILGAAVDSEVFRIMPRFEIEERLERHRQLLQGILRGCLEARIAYHRFTGEAQVSTVGEILLHVITHGFHHRGQITAHLSSQGMTPPAIDFITFTRVTDVSGVASPCPT